MKQSVVLMILDGWGIGRHDYSNPIYTAKPKNINYIRTHYLTGSLQSSGIAVGLPWDEEGNSEVGHLTIGAGKILYQHFPRITLNIESGEFLKNKALTDAFAHAKKNNSKLHIAGLAGEGNVHSSLEHLKALLSIAKNQDFGKVYLHLFADGKDSPPRSILAIIEKIKGFIKEYGVGMISSVSGRYYALDRDEHWSRTQKTYEALTGSAPKLDDLGQKINQYYDKGLTDEFIEPFLTGPDAHFIEDNDALIFFDFREDSVRQIAGSFILKDFDKFPTKKFSNLYVASMTQYSDKFKNPVAFPAETIDNPLGKVLSEKGLIQLRIAETEKYAHVTYFFNGYREKPFENEYRVLIPSRTVSGADEHPEMMCREIGTRLVESIEEGGFDFILVNFANPDMVAHTGNYDAAVQAIMAVDEEIGKIHRACLAKETTLIITSDHGNIERMIDPFTGRPETKHDPNPVPLYVVGRKFERIKDDNQADLSEKESAGLLSDVAPTILEIMNLPKPDGVTGSSLLKSLR